MTLFAETTIELKGLGERTSKTRTCGGLSRVRGSSDRRTDQHRHRQGSTQTPTAQTAPTAQFRNRRTYDRGKRHPRSVGPLAWRPRVAVGRYVGTVIRESAMSSADGSSVPAKMPAVFIGHGSPMNTLEDNRYTRSLGRVRGARFPSHERSWQFLRTGTSMPPP